MGGWVGGTYGVIHAELREDAVVAGPAIGHAVGVDGIVLLERWVGGWVVEVLMS